MAQTADITSVVRSLGERVRQFRERALGEEGTKAALIQPLLQSLGWDIHDPDQVHDEFKRRRRDKPVDYALKVDREPLLLIEAKALGEDLSNHRWISQLLGYASDVGAPWCALTDGNEWRLYNPTAIVPADEKLFLRITISEAQPDFAASRLALISRDDLAGSRLARIWETHFVDRRVRAALQKMFNPTVDPGLVRLIRKQEPHAARRARTSLYAELQRRFPCVPNP